MAKIRCAVIDDEPLALGMMASYVKKTPFLELVGSYNSAIQAMQELQKTPADLLFLDIQMPELNGLDFSRMVPPQTRIVFTTAFDQYAIDGYRVNALDYLLKPISYPNFLQAANKAQEWFKLVVQGQQGQQSKEEEVQSIFVKSEYKQVQVMLDDILYIEGLKDYIKIYEEGHDKPLLSLMSMKAMEEMLPANRFMRVHRSYIVQKSKIRVVEHNRIVFGKTYIPVGDSYKDIFQTFLNERSSGKK
jgi:DNA-binding LytR/AlgR family response regulator